MNPTSESSSEPSPEIESTALPPSPCYRCGKELDAASDTVQQGNVPEEGDYSMCLYCGALAVFENSETGLVLRRPTYEEFKEIAQDPDVRKAIQARMLTFGNRDKPGLS
jgi:DNA-directed RNA polymerase subunit RPC12/RpoP